jgi:tetratricopeptide (TPR) repeat protein
VRIHLFADEIERAEEITGKKLLQPISIPYARFTILIALANIQLAAARNEYQNALSLVNELLDEVTPLTRVDVPEALRWKGKALLGLGRIEEALQCLTEACSRAEGTKSNLYLWAILADLAELQAGLERLPEAKRNRDEARKIAGGIADSLREVGLAGQFLGQPRVRKLFDGLPDP